MTLSAPLVITNTEAEVVTYRKSAKALTQVHQLVPSSCLVPGEHSPLSLDQEVVSREYKSCAPREPLSRQETLPSWLRASDQECELPAGFLGHFERPGRPPHLLFGRDCKVDYVEDMRVVLEI